MSYFNNIEKRIDPEQRTDLKISYKDPETGETKEKENPDVIPFEYISPEREKEIIIQLCQGYIMDTNVDGTLKMIPPDEAEIAKQKARSRIAELKTFLAKTDYQAIKFAEGELSAEAYADMKAQRSEWRKEINDLESKYNLFNNLTN